MAQLDLFDTDIEDFVPPEFPGRDGLIQSLGSVKYKIEGGDGRTPEEAIKITGKIRHFQGIALKYIWLWRFCRGSRQIGEKAMRINGRYLKKVTIERPDKKVYDLYFDVTDFHGKSDSSGKM